MKKVMRLCMAGLVFSFLSSPASVTHAGEPLPAPSEPTERPVLVPGERWVFTAYVQRYLREENGLLVFQATYPKEKYYRTKDLNLVKTTKETESGDQEIVKSRTPHSGYFRFPMQVSASWKHTSKRVSKRGGAVTRKSKYKVVGYERITVQGREYDAYRIEGIDQRTDRLYGTLITFWYAPEVKNWVKFVGVNEYTGEKISSWTYELERYEPAAKMPVMASARKTKVFSSKVIDFGKTTKGDFLTKDDKPIHLGDNRGEIDDIPGHLRNLVPPKSYGWRFTLDKIPSRGAITVAVFSVAPARYRCDTMVRLNGKNLANLALEEEVGSGITTTKTISVDKTVFKLGSNELTISEDECVGYDKPVWNDSLIHAVRLKVEY